MVCPVQVYPTRGLIVWRLVDSTYARGLIDGRVGSWALADNVSFAYELCTSRAGPIGKAMFQLFRIKKM